MYVTRPLSLYLTNPEALSLAPPEGPNGGYLVLQDDASPRRHSFRLFKDNRITDLPFAQNKLHNIVTMNSMGASYYHVYFIPVINQPLSSNTYYAIQLLGSHEGKAYASSTDEDRISCCFWNYVNDVEPRPLHPTDIYQQFKRSMWHNSGTFFATSAASHGYPPYFLKSRWPLDSKTPENFSLGEAACLNSELRARLPAFNFPISYKASSPVVVGKWYCPFMFVRDDLTPKEQVKKSMFYEMTLEQQWERIVLYENGALESRQGKNTVFVDVTVRTEFITIAEIDAIQDHHQDKANTMSWFNTIDGRTRVGLSSLVVRRMMWDQERAGWISKDEKQDKVSKTEEFRGVGKWESYGCYMLVERFVLKRLDGTIVLTYNFNHTHQTRSKWD